MYSSALELLENGQVSFAGAAILMFLETHPGAKLEQLIQNGADSAFSVMSELEKLKNAALIAFSSTSEIQLSTKTVTLTREMLFSCRTDRGGITSATMRALGQIPGKARKGWMRALVGQKIEESSYMQALAGRLVRGRASSR